jgi:predicted pyridoxine 5'-phosphate oxidase superfamily flavin-nucleotide-binding protein
MAKITKDMKDIAAKTPTFIMATATREGKPNGVPIGLVKIISDDEIMLVDTFMNKTRRNIDENPIVAVSFWSTKDRYGYQFKGKARAETSGKLFDEATEWLKTRAPGRKHKAVLVVKVNEIYYVGANKDSSKNLV